MRIVDEDGDGERGHGCDQRQPEADQTEHALEATEQALDTREKPAGQRTARAIVVLADAEDRDQAADPPHSRAEQRDRAPDLVSFLERESTYEMGLYPRRAAANDRSDTKPDRASATAARLTRTGRDLLDAPVGVNSVRRYVTYGPGEMPRLEVLVATPTDGTEVTWEPGQLRMRTDHEDGSRTFTAQYHLLGRLMVDNFPEDSVRTQ
jgi:hypothetical protein